MLDEWRSLVAALGVVSACSTDTADKADVATAARDGAVAVAALGEDVAADHVEVAVGADTTGRVVGRAGRAAAGPHAVRLEHIVHMGQSLGSGDEAYPVVTIRDTGYGNFQFTRGVHTWRQTEPAYCTNPETRPSAQFALTAITGGESATGTGETIASGLVDQLTQSTSSDARHFLFSFAGQGSKRLRDLDKRHDEAKDPRSSRSNPGGFYVTSVDDVRRGKSEAEQRGWAYSVRAITWMQGERNNDRRLSDWLDPLVDEGFLDVYADDLIALKNDWNADLRAISGQRSRIPLFTYQTWGAVSGEAQLIAADRDPEIYVVSPTYYMPSAVNGARAFDGRYGNFIHLNGDSERWLGVQFAKAMKRVAKGERWSPLRPRRAWASHDHRTVWIRYHVPRPPIVIDASFLPAVRGAGFLIRGGTVTDARIASPDTIALTLAAPLPATRLFVEYASEHASGPVFFDIPGQVLAAGTAAPWPNGAESWEVVCAGDVRPLFAPIAGYGVANLRRDDQASPGWTQGPIRSVSLDGSGNTVIRGEVRELYNRVLFQAGQKVGVAAIMPLGNVRDSDDEVSIYSFASGARVGQRYPLWNWSVAFQYLQIADAPSASAANLAASTGL